MTGGGAGCGRDVGPSIPADPTCGPSHPGSRQLDPGFEDKPPGGKCPRGDAHGSLRDQAGGEAWVLGEWGRGQYCTQVFLAIPGCALSPSAWPKFSSPGPGRAKAGMTAGARGPGRRGQNAQRPGHSGFFLQRPPPESLVSLFHTEHLPLETLFH